MDREDEAWAAVTARWSDEDTSLSALCHAALRSFAPQPGVKP